MTLIAAAIGCPLAVRAQQKPMPVIGILGLGYPEHPAIALNLAALRKGLGEIGFVEGQNVAIEYRWAHGDVQRLPALAAELVSRKVDVIVTEGGIPPALAAKHATSTVPVVFHVADAIAHGMVDNLARPAGNLTGVSLFGPEALAKQYQLCSELLPEAKVVGLLVIPHSTLANFDLRDIEQSASARGVRLQIVDAATDDALEAAYADLGRLRAGAVVRANSDFADKLVALAARHAVPAVYHQRAYVEAGGLVSYGPSIPGAYVIKGQYAGRILKGAKPADLPIQQANLELAVNLKTAKAQRITVPPALLARADEVIE